jgi:hypothetical protein
MSVGGFVVLLTTPPCQQQAVVYTHVCTDDDGIAPSRIMKFCQEVKKQN